MGVVMVTESTDLREHHQFWELPLRGLTVTRCALDSAFHLHLQSGHAMYELTLEAPFAYLSSSADLHHVSLESNPVEVAPALRLLDATIADARAHKSGGLDIRFTDGSRLSAGSDDTFEAWNLSSAEGLLMVSAPGGKLTIWR